MYILRTMTLTVKNYAAVNGHSFAVLFNFVIALNLLSGRIVHETKRLKESHADQYLSPLKQLHELV